MTSLFAGRVSDALNSRESNGARLVPEVRPGCARWRGDRAPIAHHR